MEKEGERKSKRGDIRGERGRQRGGGEEKWETLRKKKGGREKNAN